MVRDFLVSTGARTDFVDITSRVSGIVRESGAGEGVCVIYVPHTTAAITINENADPDVMRDIGLSMDQLIPWNDENYRHMEGNSAAHLKSALIGCSETMIISGASLLLGTWQGIYLCEFDGPRRRKVYVQIF